ncbi:MAG: glycerophosphodiester phosphodiesterase [Firmicutes bacterium]|nr:glycerophosphodiester phosphodiesterase [Bacillota bacterium]
MNIRKTWIIKTMIAHRGLYNEEFPENSSAAFENAIDNGYAIEMDLRMLDDGTVVVFHDEKLARMSGADGYLSKMKYDDLKELKLNATKYGIPTFEEVLKLVAGRVPLMLDVKSFGNVGELEKKVIELLSKYDGQVAIISSNPYTLEYFKIHAPHLTRGQKSRLYTKENEPSFAPRKYMTKMKMIPLSKPEFIVYEALDLPNKYIKKVGLPILALNIRSNLQMEETLPFCDNILFEKFIPELTPVTKELLATKEREAEKEGKKKK